MTRPEVEIDRDGGMVITYGKTTVVFFPDETAELVRRLEAAGVISSAIKTNPQR